MPSTAEEQAPFESKADMHETPEPPLGSALFSGRWPTLKELFEAHDADEPLPSQRPWPDVKEPGPDLGDFPNSAFTLPKGRCYVELAPFTLAAADEESPASYTTPFLLRYGVTDDVEFRIFASGLTYVSGGQPSFGISPLALDFKVHLWDDQREWLLPAASLEVYVQTDWGSPQFTAGWEPSLNLNFDLPLNDKTNFEWTIGYTGVQDAVNVVTKRRFIPRHRFVDLETQQSNLSVNVFSFQWALERDLTEDFQVFLHGYFNGGVLYQQGSGRAVGGGAFWRVSPRWMWFGSLNFGLTDTQPPVFGQMGFVMAL
ncbi:MAG: transporter [Planctomycetales bacterium]